ncbi:MAG: Ycf66 family protein [Aphanothece sp. CMT-3BRIN-NPC111]|jgi:hypothetical protein|nr:Ycf66 family protein [Aphanothece sp. CMT-3BRIN-NPC111]
MLAYILALAVGLGSLGIYMAAFFFPEVHRKDDFIWSGVGLFYALVLWVCAGRITGGVLLGQIAGVALLGWFAWQTLTLRRQLMPVEQQTEVPSKEKLQEQLSNLSPPAGLSQLPERVSNAKNWIQGILGGLTKPKANPAAKTTQPPTTPTISDKSAPAQSETTVTVTEEITQIEVVPLGAEFTTETKEPAGPDMPGESELEPVPVEEIAPEVELAPPAEPLGSGDPSDRIAAPLSGVVTEVITIQFPTASPSSPSESSLESEQQLIRPNPPDPEIVEAAIEDAEAKSLPASPPEPDSADSPNTDKTP